MKFSRIAALGASVALTAGLIVGPAQLASADTPTPVSGVSTVQDLTTAKVKKKPMTEAQEKLYVMKEAARKQGRDGRVPYTRSIYNSSRSMFTIIAWTKPNCKGTRVPVKVGHWSRHGIDSVTQNRYKDLEIWYYGHKHYKAPLKASKCRTFKKGFYGMWVKYGNSTVAGGGGGSWSRPQMVAGPFVPPSEFIVSQDVIAQTRFMQEHFRLAA